MNHIETLQLNATVLILEYMNIMLPSNIAVSVSGGKDSAVLYHMINDMLSRAYRTLREIASIQFMLVYNYWNKGEVSENHTPEDVISLIKTHWDDIPLIVTYGGKTTGVNTMNKLFDLSIDGSRRSEAHRTNGKSTTYIEDGIEKNRETLPNFVKSGVTGLPTIFPLYNWTDKDVYEYVKHYNLRYL